jgi:hypothetical protein
MCAYDRDFAHQRFSLLFEKGPSGGGFVRACFMARTGRGHGGRTTRGEEKGVKETVLKDNGPGAGGCCRGTGDFGWLPCWSYAGWDMRDPKLGKLGLGLLW